METVENDDRSHKGTNILKTHAVIQIFFVNVVSPRGTLSIFR